MPITKADPIFIRGECPQVGCLIMHGFTGVPINEMPIMKIIMQYGFTVYAPLLKGHGTNIYDLEKASYIDWINDVKNAYEKLKKSGCKEILIYGHSLGGLLAFNLAENEPDIKAIISFSTPIRVHDASIYYQWRFPHSRFKSNYFSNTGSEFKEYSSCYDSYPVSKQKDVCILMKNVEKGLGKIQCPMLVIQSKKDEIVRTKSAWMICERTNAKRKEVLLLKDSPHSFINENENERIETKIHSFLHNIGYKLATENSLECEDGK